MAIEPISSIMTMQAQGSAIQKPQAPVQNTKPEGDNSEVAQEAAKVDQNIQIVGNTQDKGQADYDEQGKDAQTANQEQLRKAIEQINKNAKNAEAIYGIHEGTNRVTIKIVDKGTKEVIKELPPEKTLDMIAKVWEIAGILVDEKR